jgi:hypothetical protein
MPVTRPSEWFPSNAVNLEQSQRTRSLMSVEDRRSVTADLFGQPHQGDQPLSLIGNTGQMAFAVRILGQPYGPRPRTHPSHFAAAHYDLRFTSNREHKLTSRRGVIIAVPARLKARAKTTAAAGRAAETSTDGMPGMNSSGASCSVSRSSR